MKKALITGINGQDGSYLAEFLLRAGYIVHGVIRRGSTFTTSRLEHLYQDPHEPNAKLFLHYGDLADGTSLRRILEKVQPCEVYNLGAQSHVLVSFDQPEYTADINATGTLRLLEAIRDYIYISKNTVKVYQACSSEMFGNSPPPQNEDTPLRPRSPYAAAKAASFWYATTYRDAYNIFISNGIAFNHESPRRSQTFVTRKITRAAGRIKMGLQEKLYLGNLDAKRDWGFAGDYVEAMWRILQLEKPDNFVIATGETHSVRDFLDAAFGHISIDWRKHVEIDPRYFRPAEVHHLLGDARKAHDVLGWQPKVNFEELVKMMVDHDLELAQQEHALLNAGHTLGLPQRRP